MSSQNKSSDTLLQQMNNACYRHISNNPDLMTGNRNNSLNTIWNDPYINQKFITPLVSRHGEDYVKGRFQATCNSAINDIYGREHR